MAVEKPGFQKASKTLNFRKEVASLIKETLRKTVPFSGKISQVSIHFPSGCNSLVEVIFYHITKGGDMEYIVPSEAEETIALDGVTQTFNNVNYPAEGGGNLLVDIANHDSANPHTISVMIVITPD